MMNAEKWIKYLDLKPHPEGGFYREMHRANSIIPNDIPGSEFKGGRNYYTSIYFLLKDDQVSHFHRICSDEIWTFHIGEPLEIHLIEKSGLHRILKLGLSIENDEIPQHMVPANNWFGACLQNPGSFALVSCIVSPGFDFEDFELANRKQLILEYPDLEQIIRKLTPA